MEGEARNGGALCKCRVRAALPGRAEEHPGDGGLNVLVPRSHEADRHRPLPVGLEGSGRRAAWTPDSLKIKQETW